MLHLDVQRHSVANFGCHRTNAKDCFGRRVSGLGAESKSLGLSGGGRSRDFNIARFDSVQSRGAIFRGSGQRSTARFDFDNFL